VAATLRSALPAAAEPGPWLETWRRIQAACRRALEEGLEREAGFTPGRLFRALAAGLPEGAILYVANSLPVRDAEDFFPAVGRCLRLLGHRGLSGIDGLLSSAAGAAATGTPTVAVLGDLAWLHDVGALQLLARHAFRLVAVVLDNAGGGIYEHLPHLGGLPEKEALFAMPHRLRLESIAEAFGIPSRRVPAWDEVPGRLAAALEAGRPEVLVLPGSREAEAQARIRIWTLGREAARRALDAGRGGAR
jgi:2-succinyl-5-enolpyruvyl-6-hydroxy-3-cyclohexene-1-carboxylate synthase